MALKLFVNIAATSLANALVRSSTDMTPIPFPQLVIGDGRDYELYLVDGSLDGGGYAAISGSALYTPLIGIGDCGNPTGGTFTLTYSGQTTAALAYNTSPAAVQTALEALSNLAPGDVIVTGVAGVYYKVTFGGTLAATNVAEITGDGTALTPSSVVSVDTITAGAASPATNEVQLIQLRENPITYADDWTPITNGWSGTLSTRTLAMVQKLAEESPISASLQVTVQDPTGLRRTYLKTAATVVCTIIDPESFAGADKPTFATIAYVDSLALGAGMFTREAVTSSATGNTNITRPAGSHRHTAFVTVSGTAGTRTFAVLTTNTPAAGDCARIFFLNPTTASIVLEVRDATSGGTLLKSITTDTTGEDYFVDLVYSGSAWELAGDNAADMRKSQNLAGLASIRTARGNLGVLFARISDKVANFTITEAEDGTLFRVTTGVSAIVATLPDAATVGAGWSCSILKTDSAVGTIATSPATEGLTAEDEMMLLISDGTTWIVLLRAARQPAAVAASVINLPTITGLTGGGSTNLDGLVTADGRYPVGTIVVLSYDLLMQSWKLVSSNSITDAPNGIVRPGDYATTTNEICWKKIG
jgi:hypothetical protein